MIAKYDESELVAELKHLPVAFRAIFATACAERPVPAYRLLINYTELRSNRVLRKGIKPSPEEPCGKDRILPRPVLNARISIMICG